KNKFDQYQYDLSVVITGNEIKEYFRVMLAALEQIYPDLANKTQHLPHGMLKLPTGKMSSRTGDNILYSNFKEGVFEFAMKGILKKWPKLSKKELENRALKISMASIKYAMLNQGYNKIIIFDREKAIQFEGNTGPYLQYAYARASSIIKKSKTKKIFSIPKNFTKEELQLISQISKFPQTVENSAKQMSPAIIANYTHELSQYFNEFYH
ncbi:MAG: DALR anticodon-binding domain-containing protein, partial [Nanoarchaeota archaeon]